MVIHLGEPVISAFLLNFFELAKQKNFHKSKFCYGQIEYIMPYSINDVLFQPRSILIVCFLRLVLVFTSATTWSCKGEIRSSLCAGFKNMLICRR